jgi:acetyl esterase/lipase
MCSVPPWVAVLLLLACQFADQGAKPQEKKAPSLMVEKDLPYAEGGDQRMLDLYLPAKKSFTTVVFTYGGGWHTGSRKAVAPIGEKLQSLGYGCALISHRLAPKDKFPAQAEDVAAAFAWVKRNIKAKGGEPNRVFLMGHSSGAHLSLLIATDPKYLAAYKLSPADIAGVIGLSTPLGLAPRADKKGFGNALMAGRGADVFSRDAAVMTAASPIQHVSKDLPPVLLVVGERDFPALERDAQTFAEKARGVSREVITFTAKGCNHMEVVRSILAESSPVREQVLAFLKKIDGQVGAGRSSNTGGLPAQPGSDQLVRRSGAANKKALPG